jgi:hypothetical protein
MNKTEYEDDMEPELLDCIAELREAEERVWKASASDKPRRFKDYCEVVLAVCERGEINKPTAALGIADFMRDEDLGTHEIIHDLTLDAGSLENMLDGESEYLREWNELVARIRDLAV